MAIMVEEKKYHLIAMERAMNQEPGTPGYGQLTDFFFKDTIEGERVREEMTELISSLEYHYREQMGGLDPNLVDMAREDIIHFIKTGDPGGDGEKKRRIVTRSMKKKNSDRM